TEVPRRVHRNRGSGAHNSMLPGSSMPCASRASNVSGRRWHAEPGSWFGSAMRSLAIWMVLAGWPALAGAQRWQDATAQCTGTTAASAQLPQQMTSIGDAEFGDIDGDGDLDLVIADWGSQDPGVAGYPGGPIRVYRNDGAGHFTEDTAAMPSLLVKWSWDIEL